PPSANVTGRTLDRSASLAPFAPGGTATGVTLATDLRDKALGLAKTYEGLSTKGATAERYRNFLADPSIDTRETQDALVNQASCAPTVRAWFRELGVQAPELQAPYRWSMAPADVMAIANRANARLDKFGRFSQAPQPGDVYYIIGPEQHMGIITSVTGD